MSTLLESKTASKMETGKIDIDNFVWKGHKVLDETGKYKQAEMKLVSMTLSELGTCYDHCKTMLFNQDSQNPGRYLVLEIISDQKDRCGSELFLRYIEQENNLSRFTLMGMISKFLENNKSAFKNVTPVLADMFSSIPNEFDKLPLSIVMDACLDRLGTFNKKHITRTFILKQGIWLTPDESKELSDISQSLPRLEVIRDQLNIKPVEKLYINSKGINYSQMRAMLNLKPNKKYRDFTTMQLETLRYRILFNLEETIKDHIISWERRMNEIELVADFKGYKL